MTGPALPGPELDTGSDPLDRLTILPRWVKALAASAFVMAALSMLLAAVLFSLNRSIADDAQGSARAACLREQVILTRLIDTKGKQVRSRQGLRRLLLVIVDPTAPPPSNKAVRTEFRREIARIDRDLQQLREGQRILRRELRQADCTGER